MTPPALAFDGASFAHPGGPTVVDGLDCAFAAGVLGVVGNNGVGKSTLLKLAAGLIEPDRGRVRVRGVDTRRGAARALTAFLPESLEVAEKLTPGEFLDFVARVRGVPDPEGETARMLDRLGARGDADRLLRELSFGARRKVGLAAALMGDTPLIVLDEPGTGLDVASLDRIEALIAGRVAGGATVVLSSHDLAFVARTCDRLIVLLGGGRALLTDPAALVAETGAPDLHHAFRAAVAGPSEAPA
jgi:ABC-2 type transport system ATP-binding protein